MRLYHSHYEIAGQGWQTETGDLYPINRASALNGKLEVSEVVSYGKPPGICCKQLRNVMRNTMKPDIDEKRIFITPKKVKEI
jgi:hypothetical protein